jgi:hypothetical protein
MILVIRQRHRRIFMVLAIVLPIAFIAGIAARRPVPTDVLPADLRGPAQNFTATNWTRSDLFAKAPVQVRLLREHEGAGRFAIAFSAAKDFVKPDLIVYWVVGSPTVHDTLPENALLLGTFSAAALPLPDEATKASGALILYSLADNEIVDVSQPLAAAQESEGRVSRVPNLSENNLRGKDHGDSRSSSLRNY